MSSAPDASTGPDEPSLFPVPGSWFEVGFYAVMLVWLAYLLYETLGYEAFEDYLFPYILGVPLAVLIIVHLVTVRAPWILDAILPGDETDVEPSELQAMVEDSAVEDRTRPRAERERYEVYMLVWVTLLAAMMYFVGMGWTIVFYTFGLTWFLTRDVKQSLLVTAVVIVFIYVLFMEILRMIVWPGVLGIPDPLQFVERLL